MSNELVPAHVVKAATTVKVLPEAVRTGSAAGDGRKNTQKKEFMKYATKIFPGRGSLYSQSNG